jgi:hypothetical protein
MPDFIPDRKKYTLNFDDSTDYKGLVVVMNALALGEILTVQAAQTSKNVETVEKIFRIFARNLVEWNVCRPDGTHVPATYEGVQEQDMDMLVDIMGEWIRATSEVPAPLDKPSTSGPQSPEELISTVSLSPSLAS